MNRIALYVIAVIVGVTLLLFTCTYQVRFNQTAIVTTFGKIRGVVDQPGLHFKWPYPIQSVKHYDSRVRLLETRLENVVTRDSQLIIAQIFLAWRIKEPSTFFKVIAFEASADRLLNERLRSAMGVFTEFNFHDLLRESAAADENPGDLARIEERILSLLTTPTDRSSGVLEAYGIEPVAVGISRFVLPENTSKAVFERMKKTREAIAAATSSAGMAEAGSIISRATSDASIIESFASVRANAIRAEGEREAAGYAASLARHEKFAIFLQKLQALEAILSKDTKIILPVSQPPFDLLIGPDRAPDRAAAASTEDKN